MWKLIYGYSWLFFNQWTALKIIMQTPLTHYLNRKYGIITSIRTQHKCSDVVTCLAATAQDRIISNSLCEYVYYKIINGGEKNTCISLMNICCQIVSSWSRSANVFSLHPLACHVIELHYLYAAHRLVSDRGWSACWTAVIHLITKQATA